MSDDTPAATGDDTGDVTRLLLAWNDGDEAALEGIVPLVYAELKRLARRALRRERSGHTLEATALVHEAFLRLVDQDRVRWEGRRQFLAIAAQVMRRILVDHARRHKARKRDFGLRLELDEHLTPSRDRAVVELLALDQALGRLQVLDPRQARIVELRAFAGLDVDETAAVVGVSPRTVKRDWTLARAWLRREMSSADPGEPS